MLMDAKSSIVCARVGLVHALRAQMQIQISISMGFWGTGNVEITKIMMAKIVAAPLAKKLFKKIIDRHEIRRNNETNKYLDI